jgi:LysM repeat protein
MDLCGEPVPLRNREVLERFDREFTMVVYNHAQVYLWLKRMERYFPWIEEQLRVSGLPDDLKYVAVVESDLLPDACSPKGAAGPWQFMPSTGSAYGLRQQGSCDERYDFERATECAFRFLQDLYRRYKNWTVAIATYNCGDKRIQEQMRALGSADFYPMRLPNETERYIFRILAVKAILGNPPQYGYHLPKGQGYPPLKTERVNVRLSCPLPMQAVAEASGTTVREIKRLNPAFRADEIPEGSHQVKLPAGSAGDFEKKIDIPARRAASEEIPTSGRQTEEGWRDLQSSGGSGNAPRGSSDRGRSAPKEEQTSKTESARVKSKAASRTAAHTVKKGETLSGIAAQYKVGVEALKKANKLKSGSVSTGQKLVIP